MGILTKNICGSLPVQSEEGRTIIKLPLKAPDPIDTVIVLELDW